MEFGELGFGGWSGDVSVHGGVHAVGEDERFGECESPWFHGVGLTEMVVLDFGIGVPGDDATFWSGDLVCFDFMLDLGGETEGGV